jgi:hypothetical protein
MRRFGASSIRHKLGIPLPYVSGFRRIPIAVPRIANEENMIALLYVSSAVKAFSKDELVELLATARDNNARLGITGLLLYKDGNFMQMLEGEPEKVGALADKIAADPRHRGLAVLYKAPIEERQFPDWAMGFRDLRSPEVKELPGFSDFLNTPLTGAEFSSDPTRCEKLLLCFKRTMV